MVYVSHPISKAVIFDAPLHWKITDIELYAQKSDSKMVFSRDSKSIIYIYINVNIFAKHLWKIDFRNKYKNIGSSLFIKLFQN